MKFYQTPKAENDMHLNNVGDLPCLICGGPASPAHVRFAAARYAKPITGIGIKPRGPNGEECYVNPLCDPHHVSAEKSQHRHGDEERWWGQFGIDPIANAQALWINRHHPEKMERICRHARQKGPENETDDRA